MMIELLDRSTLVLLNKKRKYPLSIAEKDYFLALILKIIYDSPLKNKLIFKGGTAIHNVYLPHLRFSEDLDFSTNQKPVSLEELRNIFINYDFLTIKKEYTSHATIKIQLASVSQILRVSSAFFLAAENDRQRHDLLH